MAEKKELRGFGIKMKYNVDKEELRKGMHEFMKDKINSLEKGLAEKIENLEKAKTEMPGAFKLLAEMTENSFKFAEQEYFNIQKIASKYISVEEYNSFYKDVISNYQIKLYDLISTKE